MRSGEHREADEVDVFVACGGRDLLGRQPDALVDDLHARVARRDRDLLGAVGVAVEPGLADQDPDRAAERLRPRPAPARAPRPSPRPTARVHPPTPVGARYSPNTSRSAPAHSPTVPPARASSIVAGVRLSVPRAVSRSRVEGARDGVGVTGGAPRVAGARSAPARPPRRPRGWCSLRRATSTSGESADLGEAVDSHDGDVARSRCGAPARRCSAPGGSFIASIIANAPPPSSTHCSSASAASASSAVLASTTCDPAKRSSYSSRSVSNASTCWMRSDHCWSHGRGRPSASFHAGSCTARAAGVLRQGDAERLEHDALHVVLGLRLGEPERVHLHAVAEAAQLLVGDAVALGRDAVPQHAEGAQLAHLLDEADARVHEERDAPDDLGELVVAHLARLAHRVEHVDRGGERVRDLLDRRRARFLQVVRADVDRVPLRHVTHRVAHEVDGEPARRLGAEDVRAARQVLLHDVVLRGAREQRRVDAALLGQREVHAEQPHRGRVDRHRRVHLVERDALEQRRASRRGTAPGRRPCPTSPVASGWSGS